MKRIYTDAQKEEAIQLDKLGKSRKEISEQTGININTLKAITKNERDSNQTVNGSDIKEKVEDSISKNKRVVNVVSKRVITIDDLIEVCNIDLKVWQIDKIKPNKWETAGKFGYKGN